MSLSNGIMRLIARISKFSCCLYSVKIVCVRSDSVLKSRLFFAKCCHFCRCNTFKQKTAVRNLRNRSLFHFVQIRTEKFLQLTLVMKCRFFAISCILFRTAVMKKISCLRTVKNNIITSVSNGVVYFHDHLYFS